MQILKRLAADPKLSQRALAKELGISVGKTNYCLRALMEKGLVKTGNFRNSDNKLAYVYLLTPQGLEEKARLTVEFLKIKLSEYEALRAEIEELHQDAKAVALESPVEPIPSSLEKVASPQEQL
ncbi:MarR family EPS-associated transcriptional regulator [Methylogaea oryzae]|uniref:MarR family EPS-associated transcriptional regulator n=1 Tax=Methylogaea oryzae TaxID=1295382 RepID=UPI001FE5881F|nr:MarR family EPS-associated transcriptional regulator [Methylogaea oryzae]